MKYKKNEENFVLTFFSIKQWLLNWDPKFHSLEISKSKFFHEHFNKTATILWSIIMWEFIYLLSEPVKCTLDMNGQNQITS